MSMPLLNDHDVSMRTIKQVIEDAELATEDQFELMHICLNGGKELLLVAITAEWLDPIANVLEGLRQMREQ